MILRFARVLTLICLCISGAGASPVQSPIEIDEDIRVFTMVTALNVSGFDVELGSQYHPMRAELRKIASALDPDLLQRMRAYYSAH